ncbi:MAG TPA: histidine kinase, partial [Thermomicrobiales bacterium]|nr:histidine kinase [Thermomicrobiales bacterium]
NNDADWTMEFVSEGCRGLTGYDPDELTSGRVTYASIIQPADRDRVWEGVQQALRERSSFSLTYCIATVAGEERWVWEQGQGVFDSHGELQGIEGFIIDVTERARTFELLEERVADRTRELRMIVEASRIITATLDLNDLFERVFDQAQQVVSFTGASIAVRESEGFFRRASRYTAGGSPLEPQGHRYEMHPDNPIEGRLLRGEALFVHDLLADSAIAAQWRKQAGEKLESAIPHIRSWMSVPMVANDQVVGFMTLTHKEPDRYTTHDVDLVAAIANHVAIAIENARLHGQARRLAAVEERQRLARELHDSVSQALYGISLGAQTARTLLDRDPALASQPLDYVVELAQAGMEEMRALIFELRPESLELEGLVVALEKQASATRARQRVQVDVTLCSEPEWLTLSEKEALYRIAQESMHNVIKHAQATWIGLRLDMTERALVLEIVDDGKGFDTGGTFPGHLGLISMRERIATVGGKLAIDSQPGAGTTVRVELPRLV